MSNMDYCKFSNTSQDLRQCEECWDDCDSDIEKVARRKLYKTCERIVNSWNIEDLED